MNSNSASCFVFVISIGWLIGMFILFCFLSYFTMLHQGRLYLASSFALQYSSQFVQRHLKCSFSFSKWSNSWIYLSKFSTDFTFPPLSNALMLYPRERTFHFIDALMFNVSHLRYTRSEKQIDVVTARYY